MNSQTALVRSAARNNAEWVATVCRAHGLASAFDGRTWSCPTPTPIYYPDAVTLVPGLGVEEVISTIDLRPGASIKDSFADLDLADVGFHVLFDAEWIYYPANRAAAGPSGLQCHVIDDPQSLREWALAAGDIHGIFRAELLDEPSACFLAARDGQEIVVGAVATPSADVVGISNFFARKGAADIAWQTILSAACSLFPTLPVVGYERGDDLARAKRRGFEVIGSLRVWSRDEPVSGACGAQPCHLMP